MPLYNEQKVTDKVDKTRWEYAHRVELHNPINGTPTVVFHTANAELDNQTGVVTGLPFKRKLLEAYKGNEVFDVVDLQGNVVGQADYDTLFALIYSLFFHVAAKEDNKDG
jgi:hypothetical protein